MNVNAVPANDFKRQWADIGDDALAATARVGQSGWYVLGGEVAEFENELAELHGVDYAVGCASGLDAIEIGLRAAGIGAGDKVLTTPLTAFATALAVVRAGAEPVLADVDANGLLDLEEVDRALKRDSAIRAVIPVHLYGQIVDLARLNELVSTHECVVLEDAAQAICGAQDGRPLGSTTLGAATSFYPTKNLGALGDGGALLTCDAETAEKARELRDYGQSAKYVHSSLGLNSRLDELHAAILRSALLPRLSRALTRRAEIASRYRKEINQLHLRLPGGAVDSTWHLFPVFTNEPDLRAALQQHLTAAGIGTAVHYPVLVSEQPALHGRELGSFPVAAKLSETELSLPIHPYLDESQVDRVIDAVNSWEVGS